MRSNTRKTKRIPAAGNALIVDEMLFRRMLSLERMRCERTSIPFALMLLEMTEDVSPSTTAHEIASTVGAAMRETDITGWYVDGATVGVILTTINGSDWKAVESVLVERVGKILSRYLNGAQMSSTRVSFHVFPEAAGQGMPSGPDLTFYSENENKDFQSKQSAIVKRMIDVVGSMAALIVLSPIMLVIAALVKATSDGPVFFKQKRLGQFGEEITFLKFRSMHVNCDPAIHMQYIQDLINSKVDGSGGTFKIKNDPRVTAIGRFLRKSSLDELPQFINVLRGDMSLVGPRPPIPYEFENYAVWHRRRTLEVKPGITGIWQVYGRSRTTFDEMVRMDLRYIRDRSVWLDLKILVKTPLAVITGAGAY